MSTQQEGVCPEEQRRLGDEFAAVLETVRDRRDFLLQCADDDAVVFYVSPPKRSKRWVLGWWSAGFMLGVAVWELMVLAS